jgi:predicted DNA-binding ribbon-helix-helix protein
MTSTTVAVVQRVQTGIRIEKRTLKVLKAIAELKDLTVGDLLEGILLHVYEGKAPFGKDSLIQIANLKRVYGLTLTAKNSHRLREASR